MPPSGDDCVCGHPRWSGVNAPKWMGHFQAGMGPCRHPTCRCRKYRHWKTLAESVWRKGLRHVTEVRDGAPGTPA